MTGTVTPPRPPAPAHARDAAAAGPSRTPRPTGDRRGDRTLPGTVATAAMTLAVAIGFGRLFADTSFLLPVVLTTVAAHATAWWCRRHGVSTSLAAITTAGAVGLVAAWTVLGHTTVYGIPSPATLREAGDVLSAARSVFSVAKAPAEVLPGFVLATVLACGLSAFMADWAAFRLRTTFEAIIPSFTLFLFTAALGTSRHRTWAVVLFVGAALGFVVVQSLARSNRAGAWFGGRPAGGPSVLVRNAALLGAVALAGGLLVAPRLPAPDEAVVKYKNRTGAGPSNRATISPLVDIRGRLVERAGLEVFTVRSDVRSYWRLTSLDTFDGTIWSSNGTYRPTRGGIGTDEPLQPGTPVAPSEQRISITALSSIWLPAAFRPQEIDGIEDVSYNRDSASIITPAETTDGSAYVVRSNVPQLTPALLTTAPAKAPPDIASQYLSLPAVSPRVRAEALRIVAGARTPYEQARALQDHFHRGNFRYDLGARPGHDSGALENFLLNTRRGYCEQFAGAYAVLARLVGLPARVAVGFTPGELVDGVYHVRDEHAHAWPEVYLHGFGWVAFEPTPGRGAPNATEYTGRPEDQEDSSAASADTTAPPTTAPLDDDTAPTTVPQLDPGDDVTTDRPDEALRIPTVVKVIGAVALVALLWAAIVPALHVRRRRARRARAGTAAQVLAEWAETSEVLAAAGVSRRPAETMSEYAARATRSAGLQPEPARALRRLAADASAAAYTQADVPATLVERSAADGAVVRVAVLEQIPLSGRMASWLDPRPLLHAG